jgi:hypothetical protein
MASNRLEEVWAGVDELELLSQTQGEYSEVIGVHVQLVRRMDVP